jgi:hypothetical protein
MQRPNEEVAATGLVDHSGLMQIDTDRHPEIYGIAMELGYKSLDGVLEMQGRGVPYSFTNKNGELIEWNGTKRSVAALQLECVTYTNTTSFMEI